MAAVTPNINQARAMRVAMKRIEGFAKQFGEAHRNLALHAAFPLVLTPDLLYQIWANFVPEVPWTAVAHVLLSRLCRQVGYEMYEMDIADRNLLLRELKEQFGQERLDELGEFLLDYVAQQLTGDDPDTQDLAQAQEWTALAYTKPTEVARQLGEILSVMVKEDNRAEILRLTSLVETLAEPLVEAGFEPLLVYSCWMGSFVRGDLKQATTQLSQVFRNEPQAQATPADREERTSIMLEDTAQYFRLMQDWADRQPKTMRALEALDIPPENLDHAMEELDEIILAWADKYHRVDGKAFILQMVIGPQEE